MAVLVQLAGWKGEEEEEEKGSSKIFRRNWTQKTDILFWECLACRPFPITRHERSRDERTFGTASDSKWIGRGGFRFAIYRLWYLMLSFLSCCRLLLLTIKVGLIPIQYSVSRYSPTAKVFAAVTNEGFGWFWLSGGFPPTPPPLSPPRRVPSAGEKERGGKNATKIKTKNDGVVNRVKFVSNAKDKEVKLHFRGPGLKIWPQDCILGDRGKKERRSVNFTLTPGLHFGGPGKKGEKKCDQVPSCASKNRENVFFVLKNFLPNIFTFWYLFLSKSWKV